MLVPAYFALVYDLAAVKQNFHRAACGRQVRETIGGLLAHMIFQRHGLAGLEQGAVQQRVAYHRA